MRKRPKKAKTPARYRPKKLVVIRRNAGIAWLITSKMLGPK